MLNNPTSDEEEIAFSDNWSEEDLQDLCSYALSNTDIEDDQEIA